MEIPVTWADIASFAGSLFIAMVIGLWLKKYLPDWRLTSLAVLGASVIVTVLLNWLAKGAAFTGQDAGLAAIWAAIAATIETFGYEAVVNARGLMGKGARSDEELDIQATERLQARASNR